MNNRQIKSGTRIACHSGLGGFRDLVDARGKLNIPCYQIKRAHNFSYLSQVEVSFDSELPLANPKLKFLPDLIASQVVQLDGKPVRYSFGGVTAWPENVGKEGAVQAFRIERKWNTPFEGNIYFSVATVRTQEHIAILQPIEAALK